MSDAIYAALGRQTGLVREMEVVAHNLANSSTTGYKSDRAIFAEYIVPRGSDSPSLSMGGLAAHQFDLTQSALKFTGGPFDVALQGGGYFLLQTPEGERLTRAGHFQLSNQGQLIDGQGNSVLGLGGTITLPEDIGNVNIARDGTISANGQVLDQIAVVVPNGQILRGTGTQFIAEGGYTDADEANMLQGALEQSNVYPVLEVSRMIEVQRAYEAGQALLEREDKRITQLINAVREK